MSQIEALKKDVKEFTKTTYFILLLGSFTLISFFINQTAIGYITFSIVLLILLLCDCDFRAIIPMIFLWFAGYHDNTWVMPSPPFYIVVSILSIDGCILIYKIIRNFKTYIVNFKKDYICYSLIAIMLSMFLSLINTEGMDISMLGIAHFAIILGSHILVKMTVEPIDEARDYIIKSILISGLVISIQAIYILIFMLTHGTDLSNLLHGKYIHLGWAHSNHYAAILNIGMLMALYYFTKHRESIKKRVFAICCIFVFLFVNFMTVSRAGWLSIIITGTIAIVVYFIYNLKYKKNKIAKDLYYLIPFALAITAGIILLVVSGVLQETFQRMSDFGFSLNGREDVYPIAIEKFKTHPFIGNGVYTTHLYTDLWNYHNYVLQMLGTCGIVGLLAFVVYLFFSIKRSFHLNLYSVFILIVILYFLIHGLFDTIYFHHLIMPILVVLQAVEYPEVKENIDQNEA